MNKTYRVVWNHSTSTWCAASESARGRSKSSSSAARIAATTALVAASMGSAFAAPGEQADELQQALESQRDEGQDASAGAEKLLPRTRAVAADNSPYVKIDANGNGTDAASALGEKSIAIGSSASTMPSTEGLGGAVAVGSVATAKANNVAVGAQASALGDQGAVAVGAGANASGKSSIAIGGTAQATGWGAYALGRKAQASAESGLAIGDSTVASDVGATAIGSTSAATAENALALGSGAAAQAVDSVAIGSYSEADREQTVSVGAAGFERQVVNVARGTQANDAVNVAQLKDVTSALGGNASVAADGSIVKPKYKIGDTTYNDVGSALQAAAQSGGGGAAENAVQYDDASKSTVTLGGTGAAATTLTNVKAARLTATSTDAVNGAQLFQTNKNVGDLQQSLTDGGLIDPGTGASLAVVYDGVDKSSATLGGAGGTTLGNVKAGKVTASSKEAVNGGQLHGAASSVAAALGGGSAVNADGTVTKPVYKVGDETFSNVGDALQAAASTGGGSGAENAVKYDGTGKTSVTLGGKGAAAVSLKNVATGVADTDAVNVKQLATGLSDVKNDIETSLGDGSLDMKYIKVKATGTQAVALGANAVAIGSNANASSVGALAIGTGSRASGMNSVAIGVNSVATKANTVSVGSAGNERKIVNVAEGTVDADSTDAINGSQLYAALNSLSSTFDEKTQALESSPARMRMLDSEARSITTRDVNAPLVAVEGQAGDNIASLNGGDPTLATAAAIGVLSAASGSDAIAVGLQTVAGSDNSVAIGSLAQTGAGQDYAVAMGSDSQTNGTQAVAIGAHVQANADNALAVGNNNTWALSQSSVAVGDGARVNAGATSGIAMGKSASVSRNVTNAVALGANTSVTANGGVALGQGSVANRGNALSIGGGMVGQRQIINVAAGTQGTDAVNVNQLKGVTNSLGGGATVGADGSIVAPGYTIGGTTYDNVGDALNAAASQGGGSDDGVNYDDATKAKVTLAGENGTKITKVAAGDVSAKSTDAINGAQLFATNESLGGLKESLKDGGVIDPTTGASLAVVYDSATKDKVTLGGEGGATLSGVKAGVANTDAVNVSQLKDAGLIGTDGKSIAAVTYDDATKGTISLGGANGTKITKVAAGDVSAKSTDAINGAQLFATNESLGGLKESLKDGGVIDPTTGASLAVVYDSATKDKVTLGGEGGATLSGVKAGVANTDAVNVSQLKDAGLIGTDGKSIAAVTYDDATKGTISLGGANGTKITKVAAGDVSAKSTDAINGAQLFATNESLGGLKESLKDGGVIDPTTGASLAVVYDSATKDKVTLGGEGGATLSGVKAGVANTDAVNVSQLKDAGLIGTDGKSIAAVTYDRNKDGTPNYGSVTLGNGKGSTQIKNVADATEDGDALNLGQLKATGLVGEDGAGALTSLVVTYDDATKGKVTLGGEGGTTLSNVKAGVANTDAVNVSQLKDAGLIGTDGKSIAAVTYDDATKGTISLGGANGTKITKVAAGDVSAKSTDAINGAQLFATNESLGGLKESLKDGGVIDPTTGASLAVVYDSTTKDKVTLGGEGGTTLSNVKAGVANTDAVNVSQLKDAGLIGADGKSISAVTYDDATKGTISLGGANGTKITKVAAGDVSAKSTDAINGAQLFATNESLGGLKESLKDGGVIDPTTGASLAVVYDSATKDKVTLGGESGTTLSNVKAGVANTDAVNVSQLKDAGLIGADGKSIAAVTYDRNKDGTPNYGSVTLGNGKGPTQIKNVANATEDGDAVNLKQLKDAGLVGTESGTESGTGGLTSLAVAYDDATKSTISLSGEKGSKITNVTAGTVSATSKDAVNGSQLHGTADSIAGALGGGAKVNPDGTVSAPSYSLDGGTVTAHSVGDAIGNLDTRVTGNTGDIKDLKDALAGTGVIDPSTGKPIAAVTYDRKQDGTPDRTSVTLGEAGTPVGLHNVAAGAVSATSKDAINGSQLHGTAQSIAAAIGGDTTVEADGTLANTAIEVNGQQYKTVAEAVQAAAKYGATDSLAVRYDLNSDGKPNYGSVTLGGLGAAPVVLTNVADGVSQYDAVNFGQLSELADKIGGMDDRVVQLEQNPGGGGIGGSGVGSGDNPYFAGTDLTPATPANPANAGSGTGNVAAGSGASVANGANNATVIGSSATVSKDNGVAIGSGASSSGTGATAIGQGSKATGDNSVALGAGSVASEANTVSFGNGTEEGNRRIVNIADGVNASDVATKGQLDRAMGGMRSQVNELSRNAYSGIAAATALTMIPGVDPGKTLSFGIGGATYKGYQAVALGGEARITQNLKMKAGVGLSSGGNTVGMGASYQW